jgi:uncharacterized protein YdeI (YjbR/CyaY-like superfamily)
MRPTFFKSQSDFRRWLDKHHDSVKELLVGFHKKDSGHPSITWPESVDEALCFGWIDGIRRSIDDISYTIRRSDLYGSSEKKEARQAAEKPCRSSPLARKVATLSVLESPIR